MAQEPSTHELDSLSAACSKLWELDDNRLVPGSDYQLNLQVRALARTCQRQCVLLVGRVDSAPEAVHGAGTLRGV